MKPIFFVLLSLLIITSSCDDDDCCVFPDDTTISYGSSFGFCHGYCSLSITLSDASISLTKSSLGDKSAFPDIVCNDSFEEWDDLVSLIDIDAFENTNKRIGCPDCADGGAEWVEISSKKRTHRVTFEYHKEPDVFKDYINLLRDHLKKMNDSCQ